MPNRLDLRDQLHRRRPESPRPRDCRRPSSRQISNFHTPEALESFFSTDFKTAGARLRGLPVERIERLRDYQNRWNRQSLEPLVKLSAENIGKYELIDISSGTLKVDVTNIGPNDVADVGIYLNGFHAAPGWDKITLDELRPLRFATIPRLSSGNTKIVPIGKETGFHWENLLKNEETVFRKDPKFKGMLPFVRIQARSRRALGGQLFYTTAIHAVQGAALIEWDFPRNQDEFLAGYSRVQ